jgi:NitT/TauT family transport system ATP-binding protein
LLLDEPFASVDAQTRAELEDLILEIWNDDDMTTVLVTHDIDESIYLADRVIILDTNPGRVAKIVRVELPRPRDQLLTKGMREFVELRSVVFEENRRAASGRVRTGAHGRGTHDESDRAWEHGESVKG